jgi:hypothetical protein
VKRDSFTTYLEVRRFTPILVHITNFGWITEISLQGILHRDYALRLFIANEELGLQNQDSQTWTPARRQYDLCIPTMHTYRWICSCRGVSPTSEMRTEIQMRSGHLIWAKTGLASELIDVQALFNDYWSSIKHGFTVPSKSSSSSSPLVSDREV